MLTKNPMDENKLEKHFELFTQVDEDIDNVLVKSQTRFNNILKDALAKRKFVINEAVISIAINMNENSKDIKRRLTKLFGTSKIDSKIIKSIKSSNY